MDLDKIIKQARRLGLVVNSGYRTKEQQDKLEQRSCHCHSYHMGSLRLPPNEHHPNCPMYHE